MIATVPRPARAVAAARLVHSPAIVTVRLHSLATAASVTKSLTTPLRAAATLTLSPIVVVPLLSVAVKLLAPGLKLLTLSAMLPLPAATAPRFQVIRPPTVMLVGAGVALTNCIASGNWKVSVRLVGCVVL